MADSSIDLNPGALGDSIKTFKDGADKHTQYVREDPLDGLLGSYEDTSFVTGDSPVVLDVNTDLSRDGRECSITNDGAGAFTFAISNDGASWSPEVTMKTGEVAAFSSLRIDSIRITWVADSAYRVVVL